MIEIDEKPTATIYIQGLAITCFNKEKGRSETAFLRQTEHNLSLKIIKVKDEKEEILYEFSETNEDLPRKNLSIEISGIGNPKTKGFSKFEPNVFDRSQGELNDKKHLGWIIDLESNEFHHKKLAPTEQAESLHDLPLTPLFIENAHFYTKQRTQYKVEKIEIINKTEISRSYFGKIGVVLAGEIKAEEIIVNISGKSLISLKDEADVTYKIFIDNLRPFGDYENDAPEYYKVIFDSDNRQFDFRMLTAANGPYNCNKIILGETETIEGLS
ncbi:MAG: hypothetical protein MUC29_10955 [Pyrinomonadaceae bacterium]|jgi:hypothetical protein|nr:hypothetical protein [Pyrinomonadaceae bacterium]